MGGGAVMLTVRPDRGGTKDVDTWINADDATRAAVHRHIEQMAAEQGWTSDWLNENAKNFIPEAISGDQAEWVKDLPDLPSLLTAAGVTSMAQALELFETHYPYDSMKPSARSRLLTNIPHE
ncbi:MAG: hypothetical protein ABMA25_10620 [Ilumatobacteraceae bacterium]